MLVVTDYTNLDVRRRRRVVEIGNMISSAEMVHG